MGPELTQAEGFILRVGAKMFAIAGPSSFTVRLRVWFMG